MVLYLKHPNDSHLINTVDKVAGDKINIKTSVAFLSINNEEAEKEIRKTISFTIALKKLNT
jgi:hypothetical protein